MPTRIFTTCLGRIFKKKNRASVEECKDGEKGCKYFQAILRQFMLERQPQVLELLMEGMDCGFVCTRRIAHKSQYHHG